jgi:hypothetical protein
MIRILVMALAAANLLYFGWSQWVRDEQPRLVAPQAAAAGTSPSTPGAATSAAQSCTSLGPAADEIRAMEIEQLLRDMQLVPVTRTVTGSMREGWWVYVPNADAAGQARTLQSIQNAGITDAFAMADDPDFRVSVGLFMEESGARSRAEIVRGLRLDAVCGRPAPAHQRPSSATTNAIDDRPTASTGEMTPMTSLKSSMG